MNNYLILMVLAMLKGTSAVHNGKLCSNKIGEESSLCSQENITSEVPFSCEKIEAGEDCMKLKSSNVAFQAFHMKKMLRVALDAKVDSSLKLNIVSGNCKVNCAGGINECDTFSETIHWKNVSEEFYINVLESSKYYCIRASMEGCCLVCTETLKLEEPEEEVVFEIKAIPVGVLYAIAFFVFAFSGFMAFVLTRHLYYVYLISERTELSIYTNLPYESTSTPTSVVPFHMEVRICILLLYSRDCPNLHCVLEIFKCLLENCGLQVWDPFSPEEIENVRSGMENWVEYLLQMPNIRVVLVETEVAIERQKSILDRDYQFEFDEPNSLDCIFTYGLSRLQNNVDMLNNYNQLFVVRFRRDDVHFQNFVPNTRYNMPGQWKNLVSDIYGRNCEVPMTTRVEELEKKLESSIVRLHNSPPLTYSLTKIH